MRVLFTEMWVHFNLSLRMRLPGAYEGLQASLWPALSGYPVWRWEQRCRCPGASQGSAVSGGNWGRGCKHRLPGCPEKVTIDCGAVGREGCSRPRDQQAGRSGGAEGAWCSGHSEGTLSRVALLSAVEWGRTTLCCGHCPVPCRMLSHLPGTCQ